MRISKVSPGRKRDRNLRALGDHVGRLFEMLNILGRHLDGVVVQQLSLPICQPRRIAFIRLRVLNVGP